MSTPTHPYEAPKSLDAPEEDVNVRALPPPKALLRSGVLAVATLGVGAAGIFMAEATQVSACATAGLGLGLALSLGGLFYGGRGFAGFGGFTKSQAHVSGAGVLGSILAMATNGGLAFMSFAMAVMSTSDFRRGRQLRRLGKVLLPRVGPGGEWAAIGFGPLPSEARVTADSWRENGRTEHASVAAFAALTADLMALGAPPQIIADANRDALDEIRHTELCFSLARALDGRAEGPGPFPEAHRPRTVGLGRTHALTRLAVDSLLDGALHEGVSARVLAKLAKRCEIPSVAGMLKEIARDEGRHAAHGWDVVEWCVREGGASVVNALRVALDAMPASMASPLPEGARDGGWEALGIHGHALERAEYAASLAMLRGRVAGLAGDRAADAA